MSNTTTLRRSTLGIPGNGTQLAADALDSAADEVCLDLEDSLVPSEKETARETLVEIIETEDWGETGLTYRINGTDTRWWYKDVIDVVERVGDQIERVIIPKVRAPTDVQAVDTLLSSVETNVGIDPGSIGLSAQIETAEGMNAVVEIAHASDRLTAIAFGPADYTASVGAAHGATEYPGHYWHYPLSRIAHAAASAGLHAISGPYTDPDNLDAFEEECRYERALGYDGKLVVHPEQIQTANDVFAPDVEEARRAQRIVEAYEQTDPNAVAAIEGKVIDSEMYRMAKQIVVQAQAADLI